jgi:hypothetical protein
MRLGKLKAVESGESPDTEEARAADLLAFSKKIFFAPRFVTPL